MGLRLLGLATGAGYLLVVIAIAFAWSTRDRNLLRAEDGLGYFLGIAGATLMLLLLVYPLRKRVRALNRIGSVAFWFRTHMLFGVLGPLLVLVHSNFVLGSLNSRVALFCTLVVAASGIVGRYLYARIHHGLHGQRMTLASIEARIATQPARVQGFSESSRLLADYQRRVLARAERVLPSVFDAVAAPFVIRRLASRVDVELRASAGTTRAGTSQGERDRTQASGREEIAARLALTRRLAQLRGCERLFRLWHVVHFPLFLVMVLAAIVHVIAVHAY
jgi:hypothetical protein